MDEETEFDEQIAEILAPSEGAEVTDFLPLGQTAVEAGDLPAVESTTTTTRRGGEVGGQSSVLIKLDDGKAGMQGLDKAEIERVINETSKGSKFYDNEQRKMQLRKAKIEGMLAKSKEFDDRRKVDRQALEYKVSDLERRILQENGKRLQRGEWYIHVDMDAFFCAVEEQLDPSLKDKPFAVGGMAMLSTSNYIARRFGVRAAMPGYVAKKLCPELLLVGSGMEHYVAKSNQVKHVVGKYDPHFSSGGLDELCLNSAPYIALKEKEDQEQWERQIQDLEEARKQRPERQNDELVSSEGGSPVSLSQQLRGKNEVAASQAVTQPEPWTPGRVSELIREEIYQVTGLTASAGIAATPTLAKIYSNENKPNGQFILRASTQDEIQAEIAKMPVRKMPGVGKVCEGSLHALGVETFADFTTEKLRLCHVLTPKMYEFLLESSLGASAFFAFGHTGPDEKTEEKAGHAGRKSRSQDQTFYNLQSPDDLCKILRSACERTVNTIIEEGSKCSQVGIKLKYTTFRQLQTTVNLPKPTDCIDLIWAAALKLLQPYLGDYREFRLGGIRLSELTDANAPSSQPTLSQLLLKSKEKKQKQRLEQTVEILDSDSDLQEEAPMKTSNTGEVAVDSENNKEIEHVIVDDEVEVLCPPRRKDEKHLAGCKRSRAEMGQPKNNGSPSSPPTKKLRREKEQSEVIIVSQ